MLAGEGDDSGISVFGGSGGVAHEESRYADIEGPRWRTVAGIWPATRAVQTARTRA